jgi:hypothetical protein
MFSSHSTRTRVIDEATLLQVDLVREVYERNDLQELRDQLDFLVVEFRHTTHRPQSWIWWCLLLCLLARRRGFEEWAAESCLLLHLILWINPDHTYLTKKQDCVELSSGGGGEL